MDLENVSFDELETVEDMATGSTSGIINCCNDGGNNGNFGVNGNG